MHIEAPIPKEKKKIGGGGHTDIQRGRARVPEWCNFAGSFGGTRTYKVWILPI